MYHIDSPICITKVKFEGANQFGIAAKRDIQRDEYILECHGITTKGKIPPGVGRFSVIWQKKDQAALVGPARLLNHHCDNNAVVGFLSVGF